MDYIENLGDAHEALDECFHIIIELSGGDQERIDSICDKLNYPRPEKKMVAGYEDQ